MGRWLERVFDSAGSRADAFGERAEDRLEAASEHEATMAADVEVEIEANITLEGRWTDGEGNSHAWGNSTTLSTGEVDLDLGLSTDASQNDMDV